MSGINEDKSAASTEEQQQAEFLTESRQKFGEQYRTTGMPSVLIAQYMMEYAVLHTDKDAPTHLSAADALHSLRDPNSFAKTLLMSETEYQKREDQKLHARMSKLERGTHWLIGLGMGAAFLIAGPFVSTWLQPTANEIFKPKPTSQSEVKYQPSAPEIEITNITNNTYNITEQEKPAPTAPRHPSTHGARRIKISACFKPRGSGS